MNTASAMQKDDRRCIFNSILITKIVNSSRNRHVDSAAAPQPVYTFFGKWDQYPHGGTLAYSRLDVE